jgi:hypothetical protein
VRGEVEKTTVINLLLGMICISRWNLAVVYQQRSCCIAGMLFILQRLFGETRTSAETN